MTSKEKVEVAFRVVAVLVGLVAIAGFAWFVQYLVHRTTASDLEWARAVYLFTGVEAIAWS